MGLNGVAVLGLRLLPKMPIGYIDVRYGGWRQRVLVAGLDQHPLALSIWVIEKCRKCVCKWNEHVWLFKFEFDLYLNHQSLDNPTFVTCMPQFKSINSFSSLLLKFCNFSTIATFSIMYMKFFRSALRVEKWINHQKWIIYHLNMSASSFTGLFLVCF